MDSFTHIVVGVCIGEAMLEKKIGKKAILWGLLAHSLPDVDFLASLWMSPTEAMLAHRGFTHSFLFAILVIPFLSLLASSLHKCHSVSWLSWHLFFGVAIAAHLFIDVFNNYGIGWLEPFSHHRFALNWLYVVDPFFTIFPFVSFLLLLFLRAHQSSRKAIALSGLLMSFIYLCYSGMNKRYVERKIISTTAYRSLSATLSLYTTPAPMQSWLWYVMIPKDSQIYVGYVSVFDKANQITFHQYEKGNQFMSRISKQDDLLRLIRFADGYYSIQKKDGIYVFNDMRFGQVQGWSHDSAEFVFQYKFQKNTNDKMMLQRGRLTGWNAAAFRSYITRIKGQ